MQEVIVKTCDGFQTYLWLDGALVRAEEVGDPGEWYNKEALEVLKRNFRPSPLIQKLLRWFGR